ncbi:T9SS type A sorting domain-containing protein, partial [Arthrospira platensis SPKY1]|nr:T9SS type A sorting domain-containing protein [Arthrospira platensis SPKY1]
PAFLPNEFLTAAHPVFLPQDQVLIFPNPVSDSLTIEALTQEMHPPFEVKIWSADGREVLETLLPQNAGSVDVSRLTDGVYFLQLTDQHRAAVVKFVKE